MCGIVGCTGKIDAVEFLMDGLKQLEYRGYDSVGIAVNEGDKISTYKKKGRVDVLRETVQGVSANCGIGHTRWATHGKPSDVNSHPHVSGKFAVVHNGIIENYLELKTMLVNDGVKFVSETDTEVIAHLINRNYEGNLLKALRDTTEMLTGSYALAVISENDKGVIAVTKKNNPLILGRGQGANYLASDSPALASKTNEICVLKDNDFALIYGDRIEFYDDTLMRVEKEFERADITRSALELGSYESYMMKEINEIPSSLKNTAENLLDEGISELDREKLQKASRISIIACGTAYHSGLVAKAVIEQECRKPVCVEVASEYRYRNPIVAQDEVVIAVSQSGETADTIAAVRLAKDSGAYVFVITNVKSSSITGYADCVIHTKAGPEIAVAATKSYNCQLLAFYYLALCMQNREKELGEIVPKLIEKSNQIVGNAESIIEFAGRFSRCQDAFFLGRGVDYAVALEGSLKFKEISYIHSEGCPAGELKHGTLALIEKGTLVITVITQRELVDKTMNAVHEVKARGANVFVITQFEDLLHAHGVDYALQIPEVEPIYMPILSIIPLQIFAYYISRARGNDPDKPRNLAKSVTVE